MILFALFSSKKKTWVVKEETLYRHTSSLSPPCQLACAHQVRDHFAVALRVVSMVALCGRLQVLVVVDLAIHLPTNGRHVDLIDASCMYVIVMYIIMCIHTN